jgi:hypothetical protein
MIALFLGTELASVRHGPRLRELLDGQGLPEHIVLTPDLANPGENTWRRQLFDIYRGYGSRVGLFAGFPNDVRWEWVTLSPGELMRVMYIAYDYWAELSGVRAWRRTRQRGSGLEPHPSASATNGRSASVRPSLPVRAFRR